MTKREMVEEMIETLNYAGGNEKVIVNCCKRPKQIIEKTFSYFEEHKFEQNVRQHRLFCIGLLNR